MSIKGFKPFGKNTISGHHFPESAGFTNSTGKVQSVQGYSRRVPVLKKAGGGKVAAPSRVPGMGPLSDKEAAAMRKGTGPQQPSKGNGRSFNRSPLVGDCD